ncbi:MAG: hypothetical protein KAS32_01645 [Candidatus Peribacteraceae bacterium]|nr:hypothetical protein [Candidatus Peribacteraceae bacterium]
MKASSKGLELSVKISHEELIKLESESLSGILRFIGYDEVERNIPMEITRSTTGQKELIEAYQDPGNVYFGDADNVGFSISSGFYDILMERSACDTRFYGGTGKLVIEVE